jgi:hypothetical protein
MRSQDAPFDRRQSGRTAFTGWRNLGEFDGRSEATMSGTATTQEDTEKQENRGFSGATVYGSERNFFHLPPIELTKAYRLSGSGIGPSLTSPVWYLPSIIVERDRQLKSFPSYNYDAPFANLPAAVRESIPVRPGSKRFLDFQKGVPGRTQSTTRAA